MSYLPRAENCHSPDSSWSTVPAGGPPPFLHGNPRQCEPGLQFARRTAKVRPHSNMERQGSLEESGRFLPPEPPTFVKGDRHWMEDYFPDDLPVSPPGSVCSSLTLMPDIDLDFDGLLDAMSLGIRHQAIAGHFAGFTECEPQCEGKQSDFEPSPFVSHPTFVADTPGEYVFTLELKGDSDLSPCPGPAYPVTVYGEEGIRVELHWETPGDPDGTDTGSRLKNLPTGSAFISGTTTGSGAPARFCRSSSMGRWFTKHPPSGWTHSICGMPSSSRCLPEI